MALTKTTDLSASIRAVYSKEILFNAQPILKLEQFANIETKLGTEPGNAIKVLKMANLPDPSGGYQLTEGVAVTTVAMSNSMVEVTVDEYGHATSVTELLLRQSFQKVMTDASKLLGLSYAQQNDLMLRDALLANTGLIRKFANGRSSRNDLVSGDILDTDLIKDGVEELSTRNVPKVKNDYYVCFIHPHQARGLKDDPAWQNAAQAGEPSRIFRGVIGRYEDVVFVETSNVLKIALRASGTDAIDGGANANVATYKAMMLGSDSFGKAVGLPVELRDNGIEDFGRQHSLMWYAIQGAKRLDDDRVISLETA